MRKTARMITVVLAAAIAAGLAGCGAQELINISSKTSENEFALEETSALVADLDSTDLHITLLKQALAFGGRMVVLACTPFRALDMLRGDAEQTANIVLRSADGTLDRDNLQLHVETG